MLDELERAVAGDVVVRGSDAFDRLPKPFNARFDDVVPEAVVRCVSVDDVAETIAFVRRHRLELAIRSGGHCFGGRSSTHGVVIDVSPMRDVSVADGVARVGAGARLGEVYQRLLAHRVTIAGGTCPSVGIAGLTLGGGLGFLGRTYGVTSDRLIGARIVLADGRVADVDEHHDADLFWALRGGGAGRLGVVTELAFRAVPVPGATTDFRLAWPFADAVTVASAWMAWSPDAPDALAASLVVAASADPDEPPVVEVFGTFLGARSDAAELLEAFTGGLDADPDSDLVEERTYVETLGWWADRAGASLEDPRAPTASRGHHLIRSGFFERALPDEVLGALFERLARDRVPGHSRELDFSPWGGAYSRVDPGATAFVHRTPRFSLKHAGTLDPASSGADRALAREWVDGSWGSVRSSGSDRVVPNFVDPDLEDWDRAAFGANLERLRAVTARSDPDEVFRPR